MGNQVLSIQEALIQKQEAEEIERQQEISTVLGETLKRLPEFFDLVFKDSQAGLGDKVMTYPIGTLNLRLTDAVKDDIGNSLEMDLMDAAIQQVFKSRIKNLEEMFLRVSPSTSNCDGCNQDQTMITIKAHYTRSYPQDF